MNRVSRFVVYSTVFPLTTIAAAGTISASAQASEVVAHAAVAPTITVMPASIQQVVQTAVVTGSLVPREDVQVGVDLDGYRVTDIKADEGDRVTAGQVLAQLSTEMLDVQLAQNTASIAHSDAAISQASSLIAEAKAGEVQAIAALDRTVGLQSKGIVSQGSLEQTTSTAKQAAAHREAAEQALAVALADKALVAAQRRELELRYAKTTIRAPTDGIILTRSVRIGAVVSGSGSALFTIARGGAIEFSADVPESTIGQISVGQNASVTVLGKDEPIKGVVRLVAPTINQSTRLGTIRVALPIDANLQSGAFARGEIEIARQEAVALPISAIVGSGNHQSAQIVVGGRIETRSLKTGISSNGLTAITSGIEAGEAVVLRAGTFVHDGQSVMPVLKPLQGNTQ